MKSKNADSFGVSSAIIGVFKVLDVKSERLGVDVLGMSSTLVSWKNHGCLHCIRRSIVGGFAILDVK